MIKYSFIIPVYNCEKYLESCVNRILCQTTVERFEIILIDDGSVDQSGKIADKLSKQYEKVSCFHKVNGGVSSARNYGIQKASGRYILFIDADDLIDENTLQVIENKVKKHSNSLIIFGVFFDYYRNQKIERTDKLSCAHAGFYKLEEVLLNYNSFFNDNALSGVWNKVFDLKIIRDFHLKFNENMFLYEDYEFVLRYLMYIESVICIDIPCYHYRNNLDDMHIISRVSRLENLRQNMRCLLKTSTTVERRYSTTEKNILGIAANLYIDLLRQHLLFNRYSVRQLKKKLSCYCNEPYFQKILSCGVKLSQENLRLIQQIKGEKFETIRYILLKDKMITSIKRILKKWLKM